jgi:hypothetical protein
MRNPFIGRRNLALQGGSFDCKYPFASRLTQFSLKPRSGLKGGFRFVPPGA